MARPEWRGGDLRPDNRRRRQFPMIDLPSSNRFVIPPGEQLPTWSGGGTVTGAGGGASSSVNVPGVDSMQLLRNWRQSRMFNNPRITAYYNDFRPEGMSDEQWNAALNAYLEEQIYPNMLSNDPVIAFPQWLSAWQTSNPMGAAGLQQMPRWGVPVNQRY